MIHNWYSDATADLQTWCSVTTTLHEHVHVQLDGRERQSRDPDKACRAPKKRKSEIVAFSHESYGTMKFAKKLETDTENLPDELRQHLIRYKYLKKAISKIVDEMEQRGLSATLLSEWLRKSSDETGGEDDDTLKIEYFFVGKYIHTGTMRNKHITDDFWASRSAS
jgi:hypothetical protein